MKRCTVAKWTHLDAPTTPGTNPAYGHDTSTNFPVLVLASPNKNADVRTVCDVRTSRESNTPYLSVPSPVMGRAFAAGDSIWEWMENQSSTGRARHAGHAVPASQPIFAVGGVESRHASGEKPNERLTGLSKRVKSQLWKQSASKMRPEMAEAERGSRSSARPDCNSILSAWRKIATVWLSKTPANWLPPWCWPEVGQGAGEGPAALIPFAREDGAIPSRSAKPTEGLGTSKQKRGWAASVTMTRWQKDTERKNSSREMVKCPTGGVFNFFFTSLRVEKEN